jgi:hypothetical protein
MRDKESNDAPPFFSDQAYTVVHIRLADFAAQ